MRSCHPYLFRMMDETPGWAKDLGEKIAVRFDGLDERLGGLGTRLGRLDERMNGFDARLEGMATLEELSKVSAEIARVRTDLMERMDRLQEALTQQQTESFVNFAASNLTQKQQKSGQEEFRLLEEQVSALTRLVMRLRVRLDDLEGKQRDH